MAIGLPAALLLAFRTPLGAVARSRRRQLTDDELAILRDLEPEAFGAVPPAGGTWDRASKNPCFFVQAKVDERECLPYYHVVGAWQSGGRALNAKISTHPDVFQSGETHFWNEDRPMRAYLDRYDAFERASREAKRALIVGDDSPGVLANTWTESQRLHRAFKDTVTTCWKACQALPETVPTGSPDGSPTERRRCVDGDAEDNVPGCGDKGNAADPPREKPGGHALSVPHLMRAVYGDRDVKIIAVLREPVARLHAAYSHYEHYAERFGAGDKIDVKVTEYNKAKGQYRVAVTSPLEIKESGGGCGRRTMKRNSSVKAMRSCSGAPERSSSSGCIFSLPTSCWRSSTLSWYCSPVYRSNT